MKKAIFALAAIALASAASAQSSVTVFGTLDLNARYLKDGGSSAQYQLGHSGISSSRLGFRGVEDLGSGLKAGFWLESAIAPDTGSTIGNMWMRRSTVSLSSESMGEIRLGRDYTPQFWGQATFDPFGYVGVGSTTNLMAGGLQTLSGSNNLLRASNGIGYFLPSTLGGLYGQAMVAASEGIAGSKHVGMNLGYKSGNYNLLAAYGQTDVGPGNNAKLRTMSIGGSYDLRMVKIEGYFARANSGYAAGFTGDFSQDNYLIGAVMPLGQGDLRASYNRMSGRESLNGLRANQYALGYVYNLSKRTAIYGQASLLDNNGTPFNVISSPNAAALDSLSRGAEVGVRHAF